MHWSPHPHASTNPATPFSQCEYENMLESVLAYDHLLDKYNEQHSICLIQIGLCVLGLTTSQKLCEAEGLIL